MLTLAIRTTHLLSLISRMSPLRLQIPIRLTRGIFKRVPSNSADQDTWKGPQNAAEQGLESAHTSMMQALLNSDAAANYAQEGTRRVRRLRRPWRGWGDDEAVSAMKAQAAEMMPL